MTITKSAAARGQVRFPRNTVGMTPFYYNFNEAGGNISEIGDVSLIAPAPSKGMVFNECFGIFGLGSLDGDSLLRVSFGVFKEDGTKIQDLSAPTDALVVPFTPFHFPELASSARIWEDESGDPLFFGLVTTAASTDPQSARVDMWGYYASDEIKIVEP